jgi:hypothetical protein
MDPATIRHELGRRRRLVGAVLVFAIAVGVLVTNKVSLFPPGLESRQETVGISSTRVLVDTPGSQVVNVNPKGSETLGTRASLLASLMVEGEIKSAIAKRAGLSTKQLLAVTESTLEAADAAPEGTRSARVTNSKADYVLTTRVLINTDGAQLPLVEVEAEAPNAVAAVKLAEAAVTGLQDALEEKAVEEDTDSKQRLTVSPLGSPRVEEATRGPGGTLALFAAVAVFLAGCGAILLVASTSGDRSRPDSSEPDYETFEEVGEDDYLLEELMADDLEPFPAQNGDSEAFTAGRNPSGRS